MLKGFRDFLLRGNVVDLAVAVVIGGAFGAVVTAVTSDILQPLINALSGATSQGLGFRVRPGRASTYVDISALITAVVNFVIVAAAIYLLIILPMNALLEMRRRGKVEEVQATPEDIALLQEIRDLLRARGSQV